MNIAIVVSTNFNDKGGLFYAVHDRIKYLRQKENVKVDAFNVQAYPCFFRRIISLSGKKILRKGQYYYDGVNYKLIWVPTFLLDSLLHKILRLNYPFRKIFIKKAIVNFKNYDLISAHSTFAAYFAKQIADRYKIPFTATWHGSDINVAAFSSVSDFNLTKKIIKSANYNFFVSKVLYEKSKDIYPSKRYSVIYNGVDETFKKLPDRDVAQIKNELKITDKQVIAFVGNLVPVKNVLILPDIFEKLFILNNNLVFWIVGDGYLRNDLIKLCNNKKIPVKFWGRCDRNLMEKLYNVIDLIILPSKNEGLSLVLLEAIACGVNAVGSDRGGIPEVLNKENVFPLDDDFVNKIVQRSNQLLSVKSERIELNSIFKWNSIIDKEYKIFKEIINGNFQ
ncbi:MAG: glycosyltransferase [Bacteroidales bacterium]|jgi:glycosyltransferase involved in cell wall biosynthesis|nr:glycosyltransferase [Bacteroidales bacterium]MCI1785963.1 glycosyltransferase [Bacteroidales bacterium]